MSDTCVSPPERVSIIGVPISLINRKTSIDFVANHFERIRGRYICVSNVHTTVMAHENAEYGRIQRESIISLPDGTPLSLVGRYKGYTQMEKVRGMDFISDVLLDERFHNYKHFFYGCTLDTLERMVANLHNQHSNICICGIEPSPFRELSDEDVDNLVTQINKADADFVWIGIGAPRQEILMHRLNGRVNALMVGIGGVFNILAGKVEDAPRWMQCIGMEWFYRLCMEPRRLFWRYLKTNTQFVWFLIREGLNV